MKFEIKQIKKLKIIIFLCIGLLLCVTFAAAFLETYESVAITIGVLIAIGAVMIIRKVFKIYEVRLRSVDEIVNSIPGYAEIRFNKKDEAAYISSRFTEITGIETASEVVDDVEYRKIITELISCPSDAGQDIYMTARPETWVRVLVYENENYECTLIADVSEYVSCRNIIKSLKYYDSETGLLCRDAFISKVRSATENNCGIIGLISIMISGVDKVTSFKGTTAADKVITKAAAQVKRFENPHNAFAGRTSTNEFCLLLTDTYDEGCQKYANKLYKSLNDALASTDSSEYIQIYCGFALFNGRDSDAGDMIASSESAAYEAKTTGAFEPVAFDSARYVMRAQNFEKIQVFNIVTAENRIDYHFQPIVDAKTGDIFGYEALMRPHEVNGIRLAPLEMVSIANEQNMLDRIEQLTLNNLFAYLSENEAQFDGKRLFINTIPNCFVTDDEYDELFKKYGHAFDKLVIEITEGSQVTAKSIELMRSRYSSNHALFAIDDYGSGYANESTLLSIQPDIIKIDRSIISDIDNEPQKRHLVANMISFAKRHGIKTLSEGIETRGELETVIALGIDYVQGYYTGRPNPVVIPSIAPEKKNEMIDINLKNFSYNKKVYVIDSKDPVDIENLAVQGYTDINIVSAEVYIRGAAVRAVNMRIICEDGYNGIIRIENVNIFGLEGPVLTLGKNCNVELEIIGNNVFSYEGIRVPETSSFTLKGDGNLKIDVSSDNGTVLGGNYFQDYGKIRLEHTGHLDICVETSEIVGIGGSVATERSGIEIVSGKLTTELRGVDIVAIGSVSGTADIEISGGKIKMENAGRNVVGIGSMSGTVNINATSDINSTCSGNRCCAIGTLNNGSGSINLDKAEFVLNVNSKEAAAIGAIGGNVDVMLNGGEYKIGCEGNDVTGVGDRTGSGSVTINNGKMKLYTAASMELGIGSGGGNAIISQLDVVYDGRGKINAVSSKGNPLEIVEVGENLVELHCSAM